MAIKLDIELEPFRVPNYVMVKQKAGLRQDGARLDSPKYHVKDLDIDTLSQLCDEFREAIFAKAEKLDGRKVI